MGQASREDLRPAFSRGHPENCGEYVDIGDDNPNEAGKGHCSHETNHPYYYKVRQDISNSNCYKVIIRAGELEQLGDITEELVDYSVPTESDRECTCCE